jgi:hypothetical protein
MLDTLEINVDSHNVLELIQPIQMFVQAMEIAIHSTTVRVVLFTQELNVNCINVTE